MTSPEKNKEEKEDVVDISVLQGVTEAPKWIPENTNGKLKVIVE
jgi:hypothetical protein